MQERPHNRGGILNKNAILFSIPRGEALCAGGALPPIPISKLGAERPTTARPPGHAARAGNWERSTPAHKAGHQQAGGEAARAADRRRGERGPRAGAPPQLPPSVRAAEQAALLMPPLRGTPFLSEKRFWKVTGALSKRPETGFL